MFGNADASLDKIRKNSCISRTIQSINIRLSPLCFWGSAHSTESCETHWELPQRSNMDWCLITKIFQT